MNATGEVRWIGEMGTLVRDLQACVHCATQWVIDPAGPERPMCRRCMGPTCGREGCVTSCLHWEKDMEAVERATNRHEAAPLRCVHCHASWTPAPGSGRTRGWCTEHNGPLCGNQRCMVHPDRKSDLRWLFEKIDSIAG